PFPCQARPTIPPSPTPPRSGVPSPRAATAPAVVGNSCTFQNFGCRPACLHSWLAVIRSQCAVPLHRDRLFPVGVDRVLFPFAQKRKPVLLQVLDQLLAFYGHVTSLREVAR